MLAVSYFKILSISVSLHDPDIRGLSKFLVGHQELCLYNFHFYTKWIFGFYSHQLWQADAGEGQAKNLGHCKNGCFGTMMDFLEFVIMRASVLHKHIMICYVHEIPHYVGDYSYPFLSDRFACVISISKESVVFIPPANEVWGGI